MAATLKLQNRVTSSQVDLTDDIRRIVGNSTFRSDDEGRFIETFQVRVTGANAAAVRTNTNALTDELRDARYWFTDTMSDESIWMHWASDGETEKRALVYEFEFEIQERQNTSGLTLDGVQPHLDLQLAITRGHWEQTENDLLNASVTGPFDSLAASWDFLGALAGGDEPLRPEQLRILSSSGSGPFEEVWIGVRPPRHGLTAFDPLVECELGTMIEADTQSIVDATASDGNTVECDFSSEAGWAYRFRIPLSAIEGTNPEHYIGKYHVLLRAKVTDASYAAATKVGIGYGTPGLLKPHTVGPVRYITSTDYSLYDMGVFSIPLGSYRFAMQTVADAISNFNFSVEAYLAGGTAGSHEVLYDALILVPADHSVHADNISGWEDGAGFITILTENNEIFGFVDDNAGGAISTATYSDVVAVNQTSEQLWGLPYQSGLLVAVAQRDGQHVLADTFASINVHTAFNRYWVYIK